MLALKRIKPNEPSTKDDLSTKEDLHESITKDESTKEDNLFQRAKRLLHRSARTPIVGRTAEKAAINDWLREWPSKILYLAGNPGTGKTALLDEMLHEHQSLMNLSIAKTNCMMFTDPRLALADLAGQLVVDWKVTTSPAQVGSAALEAIALIASHRRVLIILDEIDQLAQRDQRLFAGLLRLTVLDTNFGIIGIANSLDLADRYLPEGTFKVKDVAAILKDRTDRAAGADAEGWIHPAAVELVARKVAAMGDLRKALEIMRLAVEIAQHESDNPPTTVSLQHVVKALEQLGGPRKVAGMLRDLNIHQKILLAALIVLLRPITSTLSTSTSSKLSRGCPSLLQVYQRYGECLRQEPISEPLGRSDFLDLAGNMEAQGLISLTRPHNNNSRAAASPRRPPSMIVGGGGGEWSSLVGLSLEAGEAEKVLADQNVILRGFLNRI